MKYIIVVLSLLICGCVEEKKPTTWEAEKERIGSIMPFTWNNHKWIRFGGGNGASVTHDPDCVCLKKQ